MYSFWVCKHHQCTIKGEPFYTEARVDQKEDIEALKDYANMTDLTAFDMDQSDMYCTVMAEKFEALIKLGDTTPGYESAYENLTTEMDLCVWETWTQDSTGVWYSEGAS